jgi:rifampicin phosphotransferase
VTIYALDDRDALDAARVGAKAARLAALHQAGLPTPTGVVLGIDAISDLLAGAGVATSWSALRVEVEAGAWVRATVVAGEVREAVLSASVESASRAVLDRALTDAVLLDTPCAVRSSCLAEDLVSASFAGQFDTVLGVQGTDAVAGAVLKCAASFVSPSAMAYRQSRDVRGIDGAVLIQRLVRARAAGVAFTVDPRAPSSRRIVIEAAPGLGETLVAGRVSPERFLVSRDGLAVQLESRGSLQESAVDTATAQQIAKMALDAEHLFGHAVDIEWAVEDDAVWLLQARPVTAVATVEPPAGWVPEFQTAIDPRYPRYSRGNIGEVVPGCISPLGWSMAVPVLEHAFRSLAARTHTLPPLGPEPTIVGTFYRRLYLNVSVFLAVADAAPGASRAEVLDELVGAVNEPLPVRCWWKALTPARIVHNVRVIGSALALMRREGRDLAAIEADLQVKTERLRREPPQTWPLTRFAAEELLTARTSDVTSLHIRLSNGATSSYRRLRTLCARHLDDKEGALAAQLVAGIGDLGRSDPAQGIFELASLVVGHSSLQELFDRERDDGCLLDAVRAAAAPAIWRAFAQTLAGFLDVHGHRGLAEVDLATPTWRQDPCQVVRLVRAEIAARGESPGARVARQQAAAASLRARVLASVPLSTRLAVRHSIDQARRYIFLRERTKDLGLRFSAHVREILHALAEKLVAAKQLREPQDLFHLTRDDVLAVCRGEDGGAIPQLLERRRREQAWCEAVILPKVFDGAVRRIDSGEETTAPEGALRGITICGGFVEGPARVLRDFRDCETLAVGEIMVAPVTDLAWTPYFLRASGLVVEIGGLLSHGSIVAREYGLPAIVGVPDVTRRIRTGDRIRLDANRGLVEVVSVGGRPINLNLRDAPPRAGEHRVVGT